MKLELELISRKAIHGDRSDLVFVDYGVAYMYVYTKIPAHFPAKLVYTSRS